MTEATERVEIDFERYFRDREKVEIVEQTAAPESEPEEAKPQAKATMANEEFYQQLADRLTLLLDSGKLPMEIRDSLYSIVDTAITESSINADNDY